MNRARAEYLVGILVGLLAIAGGGFSRTALAFQDAPDAPAGVGVGLSGGEVSVAIGDFGVGDVARAGDWAGIRLMLNDTGQKQRTVMVRVQFVDPDGDYPVYTRSATLNPGTPQPLWIYARIPFRFRPNDAINASVYEQIELEDGSGFRLGRLLGRAELPTSGRAVIGGTQGMIGVLGDRTLGLGKYMQTNGNDPWHAFGHERTEVVDGIKPDDLPDRWMGLHAMSTLVWGTGSPSELRGDRAKALREWVERGGHFVIVLPQVGQTWTNAASNDLIDIMPVVAVKRNENADMAAFRPLLNVRQRTPDLYPRSGTVHTFRRLDEAKPHEAMPILDDGQGQAVVVRRLVGAGAVTLVGVDLNQTAFAQFDQLDSEVFWHRVLGRRGMLQEDPQDASASGGQTGLGLGRQQWPYDDDIPRQIAQTGRTAVGVFAGFVMFVTYWVVAGPLGFALLKGRGQQRHAWVAFLGLTLVFTALAWGGASWLRPARLEAKHLTFLDHVYGQPTQRARMWASVLIPWYGSARLSVRSDGVDDGRSLNAIAPWDASTDESSWSGFPDSRGYEIDSRRPDAMEVPTRATAKQVQIDWAGGPAWQMPIPTGPDGVGPGDIRLDQWMTAGRPILRGWMSHKLPGTLRDITLIVVRQQTPLRPASPNVKGEAAFSGLVGQAVAFSLNEWAPDRLIDLEQLTQWRAQATGSSSGQLDALLDRLRPSVQGMQYMGAPQQVETDDASVNRRLTALALFPLLPPPRLNSNSSMDYVAQRTSAHTLDLGRWITQPCVILIGHLGDGRAEALESPVPLLVDGEPIRTQGRTIVRWVYPLPPNPPSFPRADSESLTTPEAPEPATPVEDPS